jgi:nucleoside-diphosphate-sugar epimerase
VGGLLQKGAIVRVLILGGTGLIGSGVVRELVGHGHHLFALARSGAAASTLAERGATPIAGDIGTPPAWVTKLPPLDAIIHMACDFNSDMGAVDRRLLDGLLPVLAKQKEKPRFIYTGGGWLFGATDDELVMEETPFRPLPAFAWMVPQLRRVLASTSVDGIVVHPGMVYEAAGGVFRRFARAAAEGRAVPVIEGEAVRWPLVHAEDLANLYALALERAPPGESYIGAAMEGYPVGRIARAFARRFETPFEAPQIVSADTIAAELGEWARGYALDQRLSGDKARRDLGWAPKHLDPESEIGLGD